MKPMMLLVLIGSSCAGELVEHAPAPQVLPEVHVTVCGNGVMEPGESCDDGNLAEGDGCDSSCFPEEQVSDDRITQVFQCNVDTAGARVGPVAGMISSSAWCFWIEGGREVGEPCDGVLFAVDDWVILAVLKHCEAGGSVLATLEYK